MHSAQVLLQIGADFWHARIAHTRAGNGEDSSMQRGRDSGEKLLVWRTTARPGATDRHQTDISK